MTRYVIYHQASRCAGSRLYGRKKSFLHDRQRDYHLYELAWDCFENPKKVRRQTGVRYLREFSELDEFREIEVVYRCKTHDFDRAISYLDKHSKMTRDLISQLDVWRSIRKLAKVLVVQGSMDADEVKAVLGL
jgi:hypothetical protein